MIPISGIEAFTTIDFPGALSCVLFTQGCPWRCRYCHNPDLQKFHTKEHHENESTWSKVRLFLQSRQGKLDAVVISGGEPTAHQGLADAILDIKKMGFKVGLHTAGIYPEKLSRILELIDWVGFDIKAPLDELYDKITQVKHSAENVKKSLEILKAFHKDFEFRCTWHPSLLSDGDIDRIQETLKKYSFDQKLKIQKFREQGCQDLELRPPVQVY